MQLIYLAQDRVSLKWPEVSGTTVFVALIFFAALFFLYYFINTIKKKTHVQDESWEHLQILALKKGFSQKEISILHGFFSNLSISEKETFNPTTNKKHCYSMLYSYFLKNEFLPADQKIQILGKLFFERKADFQPKSTLDLSLGEVVALETSTKKYLTLILKKTDSKLLLKNNGWLDEGKDLSIPCAIFCYRTGFGGFALLGKILAVVKEGIVFDYFGKIERRGEERLVTSVELPFEIKTWSFVRKEIEETPIQELDVSTKSLDEIDELLGNKALAQPKKDLLPQTHKIETVKGEIRNYALSEKLTDKSVQFKFVGSVPEEVLRRNEIWEIQMKLPNNFMFKAKGKVVQVPNSDGSFLIKFTEVSDESKQNLVSQIRDLGVDRE